VGRAAAEAASRDVLQWARWLAPAPAAAASFAWLPHWLSVNRTELSVTGLAALLVAVRWRQLSQRPGTRATALVALGCLAVGFATAPDPRFWIGAVFTLVGIAALAASRSPVHVPPMPWRSWIVPALATMLLLSGFAARHSHAAAGETDALAFLWRPPLLRTVPLAATRTAAGLDYLRPADGGDQCWRAPLPCAPRLLPDAVTLRDAQRGLGGGFHRVDPVTR
jgi:hypothetical protein